MDGLADSGAWAVCNAALGLRPRRAARAASGTSRGGGLEEIPYEVLRLEERVSHWPGPLTLYARGWQAGLRGPAAVPHRELGPGAAGLARRDARRQPVQQLHPRLGLLDRVGIPGRGPAGERLRGPAQILSWVDG